MAKGLRASVNKRNKSKLRGRVFGPAEAARTERLSAKLLELAQQPKPTKDTEMLVDGQSSKGTSIERVLFRQTSAGTNTCCSDHPATADSEEAEKAATEGQSLTLPSSFALSIPSSLSHFSCGSETCSEEGSEDEEVSMTDDSEDDFYTMLGLSADITGFTTCGSLKMLFEH